MAGTVAHVLNLDLFGVLDLPQGVLDVLFNEALRQRAMDVIFMSRAFAGDKDGMIERHLKAHGHYTEGFYEKERSKLREMVDKVNG